MRTTFTTMLTDAQAGRLESILEGKGFERREVPYARFSFAGPSLLVTVYEKKNKLLLQGKGTDDFIEFTLEPQVTGLLSLPEEAEEDEGGKGAHFGIDESGKGDYFGPLVIAGVYADLPLLMLALCLLPAMALGLWCGRRLTMRMSREAFVRLVTWLVLASGIALIGRYLST